MPWKVLGAQVDAVGGSPGDRVGESVSHSSLRGTELSAKFGGITNGSFPLNWLKSMHEL